MQVTSRSCGHVLAAAGVLLLVGACANPTLPAVDSFARAYAQQIGTDSLRITVMNGHERVLALHLCGTHLQAPKSGTWADVEGAGPVDCDYSSSTVDVRPYADTTVTLAYRFGEGTGTRRVVIDAILGGTREESRNVTNADDVLTSFPLGEQP